MGVVHAQPHMATHIAPSCSRAMCFNLLLWLVCVLAPFFLAYYSNGLWIDELTARVVPTVEFKHQAMVMVEGSAAGSDLHWTTEPALNQLYGTRLRPADVSSYEKDANYDNKPESAHIVLRMPLLNGETVSHASVLLVFQYKISETVTMEMETLAYIDVSSAAPGSRLWVDGELRLRQTSLLGYHGVHTKEMNAGLLQPAQPRFEDAKFSTVLGKYLDRNITTYVDNLHTQWTVGSPAASDAMSAFEIDVTLRFPPEYIRYRPGFWETMKFAWIQYLSIFLVIRWLAVAAKDFVYNHRLVDTIVLNPEAPARVKPNF